MVLAISVPDQTIGTNSAELLLHVLSGPQLYHQAICNCEVSSHGHLSFCQCSVAPTPFIDPFMAPTLMQQIAPTATAIILIGSRQSVPPGIYRVPDTSDSKLSQLIVTLLVNRYSRCTLPRMFGSIDRGRRCDEQFYFPVAVHCRLLPASSRTKKQPFPSKIVFSGRCTAK